MKERRIVEVGEYKIIQAANNHIGIYKNAEAIFHAQYTNRLNEEQLRNYFECFVAALPELFKV